MATNNSQGASGEVGIGNGEEAHGSGGSGNKSPLVFRYKMALACDVCRRRKVKCSGASPCARCDKSKVDCTFTMPHHLYKEKSSEPIRKRRKKTETPAPALQASESSAVTIPALPQPQPLPPSSLPSLEQHSPKPSKEHLLLIDPDDQLVCSGPSTGMPLLAKLGLLNALEETESRVEDTPSRGNPTTSLGLASAVSATGNYWDLVLARCDQNLMHSLIKHHLQSTDVFFPLLHSSSFLSEYIAVTERRLICTPQYGALIMSILAVTARVVESARALFEDVDSVGDSYYDFARDLLHVAKNKLDIRYILALYNLAIFTEGRSNTGAIHASYVSEAVGLAFATGLHRSAEEWDMDAVTSQIRTRLFWAIYLLDVSLAYSQGRPALIRLSECSVELPLIIDNSRITKEGILNAKEGEHSDPPVAMASACALIECFTTLEEVLSAINAPVGSAPRLHSFWSQPMLGRSARLIRASSRLDQIEAGLPPYLNRDVSTDAFADQSRVPRNLLFLQSLRISTTCQFIRTLIARQRFVEELEETQPGFRSSASKEACDLSLSIIRSYSKSRHFGLLQFFNFHAVSHLVCAGHTLLACMMNDSNTAFEYRPELLIAIDVLLVFKARYPSSETAAHMLIQLSRRLDYTSGASGGSDSAKVRILARKPTPSSTLPSSGSQGPERVDFDWLVKAAEGRAIEHPLLAEQSQWMLPSGPPIPQANPAFLQSADPYSGNHLPTGDGHENDWEGLLNGKGLVFTPDGFFNVDATWEDNNFSFLNDGLFKVV